MNELQKYAFSGVETFEVAQRMAKMLQESDLVPAQFQKSLPNCVLALEMSQRLGMNPLAIMQNLYVVHGKPAWSSQFLIACINGCGRFSPLRYELTGEVGQDSRTCVAWAYDLGNNERIDGPPVSIALAKAEGWYQRSGSKWRTMSELLLRYRAATLFARTFCPELTMGLPTHEEIKDIGEAVVVESSSLAPKKRTTASALPPLQADAVAEIEPTPEPEPPKRGRGRPRKEDAPAPEPEPVPAPEPVADPEPIAAVEPEPLPEVEPHCAEYEALEPIYQRTPKIVRAACDEVGHKMGVEIRTFREIDGADRILCSEILAASERILARAKGN